MNSLFIIILRTRKILVQWKKVLQSVQTICQIKHISVYSYLIEAYQLVHMAIFVVVHNQCNYNYSFCKFKKSYFILFLQTNAILNDFFNWYVNDWSIFNDLTAEIDLLEIRKTFGEYDFRLSLINFVMPVVEHNSIIWKPYYEKCDMRIESIQTQFVLFALWRFRWLHGFV